MARETLDEESIEIQHKELEHIIQGLSCSTRHRAFEIVEKN